MDDVTPVVTVLLWSDFLAPEIISELAPICFGGACFGIVLRLILGTIEGLLSSIRVMTTGFVTHD